MAPIVFSRLRNGFAAGQGCISTAASASYSAAMADDARVQCAISSVTLDCVRWRWRAESLRFSVWSRARRFSIV
jgi:hypothetical protein